MARVSAAQLPPLLRLPAELLLLIFEQLKGSDFELDTLLKVSNQFSWQRTLLSKSPKVLVLEHCAQLLDHATGTVSPVVRSDATIKALQRNPTMYSHFHTVKLAFGSPYEWSSKPRRFVIAPPAPEHLAHIKKFVIRCSLVTPIVMPFSLPPGAWNVQVATSATSHRGSGVNSMSVTLKARSGEHSTFSTRIVGAGIVLANLDKLEPLLEHLDVTSVSLTGEADLPLFDLLLKNAVESLARRIDALARLCPALKEIRLATPARCDQMKPTVKSVTEQKSICDWLRAQDGRKVVIEHERHDTQQQQQQQQQQQLGGLFSYVHTSTSNATCDKKPLTVRTATGKHKAARPAAPAKKTQRTLKESWEPAKPAHEFSSAPLYGLLRALPAELVIAVLKLVGPSQAESAKLLRVSRHPVWRTFLYGQLYSTATIYVVAALDPFATTLMDAQLVIATPEIRTVLGNNHAAAAVDRLCIKLASVYGEDVKGSPMVVGIGAFTSRPLVLTHLPPVLRRVAHSGIAISLSLPRWQAGYNVSSCIGAKALIDGLLNALHTAWNDAKVQPLGLSVCIRGQSHYADDATELLEAIRLSGSSTAPASSGVPKLLKPLHYFKLSLGDTVPVNETIYGALRKHIDLSSVREVAIHTPHGRLPLQLSAGTFKKVEELHVALSMDSAGDDIFALRPLCDAKLATLPAVKKLALCIVDFRRLDKPQATTKNYDILKLFKPKGWAPSAKLEELAICVLPSIKLSSQVLNKTPRTDHPLFHALAALQYKKRGTARKADEPEFHTSLLKVLAQMLAQVPTVKTLRLEAVTTGARMEDARRIVDEHPTLATWAAKPGNRVLLEYVST